MSDWQPIETAPKDGTRVLIYVEGFIAVCEMCEEPDGSRRWICGETTRLDGRVERVQLNACATHWMPLPAPPVPA